MDEIVKKLATMGVTAAPKDVKAWLRGSSIAIEAVDDATIFAMAEALGSAIAPMVENLPVGWDAVEGGGELADPTIEPSNSGESIVAIAARDATLDADRVLSEYQSAYKRVFGARVASLATFRSEYRSKAAALFSA